MAADRESLLRRWADNLENSEMLDRGELPDAFGGVSAEREMNLICEMKSAGIWPPPGEPRKVNQKVTPTLRFRVFTRDKFTCAYCGGKSPNVVLEPDHRVPKSKGGRTDLGNLVTACFECNRGKRDKSI